MNKIILNNKIELEVSEIFGIEQIVIPNKTVEELEKVFTKENCKKIKFAKCEQVYCVYNNLECSSITKNIEDNTITVNLHKLNDLAIKVEELQNAVDLLIIREVM